MNAREGRRLALLLLLACVAVLAASARAQDQRSGEIVGSVLDGDDGSPLDGVKITLTRPDGSGLTKVTRADGTYEFKDLPKGDYQLRFEKDGYKESRIATFAVDPDKPMRSDLRMPRAQPDVAMQGPPGVEEFVVVGTKAEAIEAARAESDKLVNTLNAAEISKFAANDVADALKFVPGVSVQKGQFAIIRGLEDRYSSVLYNGGPIPSPDPDRQSVQLDLFPSEVVSDIVVTKTFAPDLPSNSSGGSIDIVTHDYPEGFEVKGSSAVQVNSNAKNKFIHYDSGSSVGRETDTYSSILGSDFGLSLAGRGQASEREVRYKVVLSTQTEYETANGTQQGLEPVQGVLVPHPQPHVIKTGGLALGQLALSDGQYDLTDSEKSQQDLAYGGFGFDFDHNGNHRIDLSAFYTHKQEWIVEEKDNGTIPSLDYGALAQVQRDGGEVTPGLPAINDVSTPSAWITRSIREKPDSQLTKGPMWSSNFGTSSSFDRDRDLLVTQLGGDHVIEQIPGLHASWAANYAKTTQKESALGTRIFFEPDDPNIIPSHEPPNVASLGPGRFVAPNGGVLQSSDDVDEHQYFGRLDADYERMIVPDVASLKLSLGGWLENAHRGVGANFLQTPTLNTTCAAKEDCLPGGFSQFAFLGDTRNQLGHHTFSNLLLNKDGTAAGSRNTTNDSSRKISAGYVGAKNTLWDQIDLLGGTRLERIQIDSNNSPYTGDPLGRYGAPATFPETYLFFDRLDNVDRMEVSPFNLPPKGTVWNDQILGIHVPKDPNTGLVDLLTKAQIDSLVNGKIDETRWLPSAGFAYRPEQIEGLALRGAWSQTVARPSFREMGFYVSVEPGQDDLIVGNPQLKLSDVESYDLRLEYMWGEGDLASVGGFYKTVDDPIESIVIRNPIDASTSPQALYRTFFNNPNRARLAGIETELRKNLGFLGFDFAEYFTIGGNFTYIDAKVDRTRAELQRSTSFFGVTPGTIEIYQGLSKSRRLFGQPEWIANADLTFDQPDWGTQATVAFFGISDVLDAAGVANLNSDNKVFSLTLDRYVDSYSRLDVILSQRLHTGFFGGDLIFKISGKNLTNTTRRIVYDPGQTEQRYPERAYKVGRNFKFTIGFEY
jgi:TonB-dependent receptor